MNARLKLFLYIIWILSFFFMIFKMKQKRADIRYILPWLILDLIMCLVTAFPSILVFFCNIFGIETPSNMMFFFGMIFLIMIIFSMALDISRLNENIRDISQRLSLYEKDPVDGVSGPSGRPSETDPGDEVGGPSGGPSSGLSETDPGDGVSGPSGLISGEEMDKGK